MGAKIYSIIFFSAVYVLGVSGIDKCGCDDSACIQDAAMTGLNEIMSEFPSCVNTIRGYDEGLYFRLSDPCISFPSRCNISNVESDFSSEMNFTLYCPRVVVKGKYFFHGNLFGLTPIKGSSNFTFESSNYVFNFEMGLSKVRGGFLWENKSDVFEMTLRNVTMSTSRQFQIFDNLFEGDPDEFSQVFSTTLIMEANKDLLEEKFEHPVMDPFIKTWIESANEYLKQIPANETCT